MMAAAGKTLGGVRCDPSTALKILEADGETLYRTKSRKFFFQLENGALALTDENTARVLIEQYAPDMLGIAFDKEPIVRVVLELPEIVVNRIDHIRGPRSRKAAFLEAAKMFIQKYDPD